jgi:hypothetical protein
MLLPAVAICAALAGAGPATSAPARCSPSHAQTVLSSAAARVYWRNQRLFACWRATGRTTRVDVPGSPDFGEGAGTDETIRPLRLSGAYLAYTEDFVTYPAGSDDAPGAQPTRRSTVDVFDVEDGKPRVRVDPGTRGRPVETPGPPEYKLRRLVLRPSGSIAWTAQSQANVRVNAVTAGGDELLSEGAAIDPRSLRLEGARVSWTDGTARRTHALR